MLRDSCDSKGTDPIVGFACCYRSVCNFGFFIEFKVCKVAALKIVCRAGAQQKVR